jgi:hypothetical protein
VVPFKTLKVEQTQIAKAKAPIAVVVRQLDQPRCNFFILYIELALVAVTRLADPKGLACHSDANATFLDCFHGHILSSGWPYHFFSRAFRTSSIEKNSTSNAFGSRERLPNHR